MAVTLRSTTPYNSGATPTSSFNMTTPSGIQQGDLMYVQMGITGGTGTTVTPPSGWTLRGTVNSTTVYGSRTYTKIAGASEGSSFTFTVNTSQSIAATMALFIGADPVNPIGGSTPGTGTGATVPASSFTPSMLPAYTVNIVSSYSASAGSTSVSTPATGWTVVTDVNNSAAASSFIQNAMETGVTTNDLRLFTTSSQTLSSAADLNHSFVQQIRSDQSQYTVPTVDYTNVNSGSGTSVIIFNQASRVNEPAYALVSISGSGTSVSSITASGLTWTFVANSIRAGQSTIELWQTTLPSTGLFTSTVNFSGSSNSAVVALNFSGAILTAGVMAANAASGAPTSTTTTLLSDSWMWALIGLGTSSGVTADSNDTVMTNYGLPSSGAQAVIRSTSFTPASGTSVTNAVTAPTTIPYTIIQFEVGALPTIRTQTGISRIQLITGKTQTGKSKITATTLKTQTGKSRITATTTKLQTGVGNIRANVTRIQTGVSTILLGASRNQLGRANIRANTLKTQTGKSRISIVTTRTQTGVSRIQSKTLKTITGVSNILLVRTKLQLGISNIQGRTSRFLIGRANIAFLTQKTQTGKSRITTQQTHTTRGTARIVFGIDTYTKPALKGVVFNP